MTLLSLATCWILDLSGILSMSWMIEFMSVSKKLSYSIFTKFPYYDPRYCCKVKTERSGRLKSLKFLFFCSRAKKTLWVFNLIKATGKGENTFDEMHGRDFFILPFRYLISDSSIILRYHNKLVKFETLRLTSYHLILVQPENIRYGVTDILESLLHVNQIIIDVCITCYSL